MYHGPRKPYAGGGESPRARRCCAWRAAVLAAWPTAVIVVSCAASVVAQEKPAAEQRREDVGTLFDELRKIGDWDREYELIAPSIEDLWKSRGWDEEADVFARDAVLKVAKIPPWQVMQRLQTMTELVRDRYGLTPEQTSKFQQGVLREVGGMLFKNAPLLARQTREFLETRDADQPFTPEQVQKWTIEAEPLIADGQQRMDRLIAEMRDSMSPEQRAILERDVKSYEKRIKYMTELQEKWKKGRWEPADWGIDKSGRWRPRRDGDGPVDVPVRLTGSWKDYDPATWPAFATFVEGHFSYDPGQRESTRSILTEVTGRAEDYIRTNKESLESVSPDDRATSPAWAPVRNLFQELELRSLALRTASQRESGGAASEEVAGAVKGGGELP